MADNARKYWMPIVSTTKSDDGRIKVVGVASDYSRDLQKQVVKAAHNPNVLDYIKRGWAAFDLDHHSEPPFNAPIIGRPTDGRMISVEEAQQKYPGFNFIGPAVLEVEGYVHALPKEDEKLKRTPPDLKTIHHYYDVGEKMGMSIRSTIEDQGIGFAPDGTYGEYATPGPIFKIALTPIPVNGNTPCIMVKSAMAALMGGEMEVATVNDYDPYTPCLWMSGTSEEIQKSLAATGVTATAGTTGGDSLKTVNGGGSGPGRVGRRCHLCHCEVSAGAKYCSQCGGEQKGDSLSPVEAKTLGAMVKSLQASNSIHARSLGDLVQRLNQM